MAKTLFFQSFFAKDSENFGALKAHVLAWVMMILGMGGFVYWRLFPKSFGGDSVPLHYNIHLGTDAFGPWWMLFFGAGFGVIVALVNGLAFAIAKKRAPRRAALMLWVTTATLTLLCLGTFFVVLLNVSYD